MDIVQSHIAPEVRVTIDEVLPGLRDQAEHHWKPHRLYVNASFLCTDHILVQQTLHYHKKELRREDFEGIKGIVDTTRLRGSACGLSILP